MDWLATCPARHAQALAKQVGDETLVLKLDSGRMAVLNRVGDWVWNMMDGKTSLGAIADDCAEHYQVDRDQVARDVVRYVQDLVEREMVVLAPPEQHVE